MFSSRSLAHVFGRAGSRGAAPLVPLVVIAGLLSASVSTGAGTGPQPGFSGDRAMELLVAQCEMGPRTPGSEGNRQLREMILAVAEKQGFGAHTLCFTATNPLTGETNEICNIVVSAGPEGGSRLWLGAHYDTRPVSDHDPDRELRATPLVGANDGASGVAVLMHLMEILGKTPPDQGVDFIFFDGEDSGVSGEAGGFCLGSRHLAASCRDFGNPLSTGVPRGLIVLDMVGQKNLSIPMEAFSLVNAPEWTAAVFARAESLGLTALVPRQGQPVYDDHVPFLEQGIPAVDLIDFDYPQWHTTADTPDKCSGDSLAEIGRLMLDMIFNP